MFNYFLQIFNYYLKNLIRLKINQWALINFSLMLANLGYLQNIFITRQNIKSFRIQFIQYLTYKLQCCETYVKHEELMYENTYIKNYEISATTVERYHLFYQTLCFCNKILCFCNKILCFVNKIFYFVNKILCFGKKTLYFVNKILCFWQEKCVYCQ